MRLLKEKPGIIAAHICKITVKTIPRCGKAALIMLCLGFYFLFPACQIFQQIQVEESTSYELVATMEGRNIDLNTLMQINGVERASPILNISASFDLDDQMLDCKIKAVYSSFLGLRFEEGTMYPDNSNTPYLIMNKASAEIFLQEQKATVGDTVRMIVNGKERKVAICGVFEDGSEIPSVYMSYDTALREFGQSGNTELILALADKGVAENVISTLYKHDIHADFDSNITLAWDLMQKQSWYTLLVSFTLICCAVVLIRKEHQTEIKVHKSESAMLLSLGMTANAVQCIYPVRIIFTEIICMVIATMGSVIMGTFTFLAVFISICVACVIWVVLRIKMLKSKGELL